MTPLLGIGRKTIRLNVKVPKEFKQFEAINTKIKEGIEEMVLEAGTLWETEAGQALNTARERYIKAIQVHSEANGAYVELDPTDKFVNKIEKGSRAYDLKPGFLNSPKAKINKEGVRFRNIELCPIHKKSPHKYAYLSDKTHKDDWWHPGFKGLHIKSVVYRALKNDIIPRHVDRIVNEINFKGK